ncbi:MAG: cation transporter [Cyclobacteriaceae bacterium]
MESTTENENTKKETYLVEGMSCSGCERTVQKVITGLEGVKSAKADVTSASVSIEYDPTHVNIEAIMAAVNKVGYRITGKKG